VFVAAAALGNAGEEGEVASGGEVADGEDVPGVFGDNVGDQEIDLFGGVADFGGAAAEVTGGDVIGAVEIASGRLYLNAPEAAGATSSGVEDEIVGFAVAAISTSSPLRLSLRTVRARVLGVCPIKRGRTSRVCALCERFGRH